MSFKIEAHLSILLGNDGLASPSFIWAWHILAPACLKHISTKWGPSVTPSSISIFYIVTEMEGENEQ
jgi:hypothetical protein